MTIFAIVIAIFLLSLWLGYRDDWDIALWPLLTVTSGMALLCLLLALGCARAEAATNRAQIAALNATIERARASGRDPLESAAIHLKIAEANAWITSVQYWNGTAFDMFWPDWVDDLKPVE